MKSLKLRKIIYGFPYPHIFSLYVLILLLSFAILPDNRLLAQESRGVAISDQSTSPVPHPAAILDLQSSERGVLLPRLTRAERDAIVETPIGLIIFCLTNHSIEFFDGMVWKDLYSGTASTEFQCGDNISFYYNGEPVVYGTVAVTYNGIGTVCWMDRNLGAQRPAEFVNDHLAYGDLFQWGRGADGHQLINWTGQSSGTPVNTTTSTLWDSNVSIAPDHGHFITSVSGNRDWLSPQVHELWKEEHGDVLNNPCPRGWRVPTIEELDADRVSWVGGNHREGAFYSPLKWPAAGYRFGDNGNFQVVGATGYVWSSSIHEDHPTAASSIWFGESSTNVLHHWTRHNAKSVRCVLND